LFPSLNSNDARAGASTFPAANIQHSLQAWNFSIKNVAKVLCQCVVHITIPFGNWNFEFFPSSEATQGSQDISYQTVFPFGEIFLF
jgi:hypothetical protein